MRLVKSKHEISLTFISEFKGMINWYEEKERHTCSIDR